MARALFMSGMGLFCLQLGFCIQDAEYTVDNQLLSLQVAAPYLQY